MNAKITNSLTLFFGTRKSVNSHLLLTKETQFNNQSEDGVRKKVEILFMGKNKLVGAITERCQCRTI